jgi:prepilin-type processing-associated H-X9-DG protein/prepilin-type N-terminal cleavage/methylation domain-containing protein
MNGRGAPAFTLVELLVVIAIIGTLVGIMLPAVQSSRESARNNTCKNNLKQVSLALLNYDTTLRRLPGYVNALVDPNDKSVGRRASWAVMIFPYMEEQSLWDEWSKEFSRAPRAPFIQTLVCPSDEPDISQPWLRYVVNAGWGFAATDRGSPPAGPVTAKSEALADGVFVDAARNTSILAVTAAADGRESGPGIVSRIAYVQTHDGATKTLMVSENVHTWYWAYDADVNTADYEYGALPDKDNAPIEDAKHPFGFIWSNSGARVEHINGDNNYDATSTLPPKNMVYFSGFGYNEGPKDVVNNYWESYGYPSSRHSSGVNVAFCDGHIVFLRDTIERSVYAMLMTSNRHSSHYYEPVSGLPEKKMSQPASDDL